MVHLEQQASIMSPADASAGLTAALLILVQCLDRAGVLTIGEYRDKLSEMYRSLPATDRNGGAGVFFDGLLSLLDDEIASRKG